MKRATHIQARISHRPTRRTKKAPSHTFEPNTQLQKQHRTQHTCGHQDNTAHLWAPRQEKSGSAGIERHADSPPATPARCGGKERKRLSVDEEWQWRVFARQVNG